MRHLKKFIVLLVSLAVSVEGIYEAASTFYRNGERFEYYCSFERDTPITFDCACVAGLWVLSDSCGQATTIPGDVNYCTSLNNLQVTKGVRIIHETYQLAVLMPNGTVFTTDYLDMEETKEKRRGITIDHTFTLVTGSDWMVTDTSGRKVCLSVHEPHSYCFFSNVDGQPNWKIDDLTEGCKQNFDHIVQPSQCYKIRNNDRNFCHAIEKARIVKRQAEGDGEAAPPAEGGDAAPPAAEGGDAAAAAPPAAPAEGGDAGSSAPASGGGIALVNGMIPEDEDYAAAMSNNTHNSTDSPLSIEKGIIDYMDANLDMTLNLPELQSSIDMPHIGDITVGRSDDGLVKKAKKKEKGALKGKGRNVGGEEDITYGDEEKKRNPLNVTYSNPVYEFLEVSKRVMQKTCPPFYVKPEFLNMAVATFIRLQQLQFKFPENTFKPVGFRRVLNSLRDCEMNAVSFNFTNSTSCDNTYNGKYTAFGQEFELTITSNYADLERHPIVETVWKIFFNAHSYCFPFFNKTLDHHRFATWMLPLFQNEMNDLWTGAKTTNMSLSGLFGNQIIVQGNLGYCAVSSRLVSNYPWDLARPMKITDGGGNGTAAEAGGSAPAGAPAPEGGAAPAEGDPPAAPPAEPAGEAPAEGEAPPPGDKKRKKREIKAGFRDDWKVLENSGLCMDEATPLLCPNHVKNIAIANY